MATPQRKPSLVSRVLPLGCGLGLVYIGAVTIAAGLRNDTVVPFFLGMFLLFLAYGLIKAGTR